MELEEFLAKAISDFQNISISSPEEARLIFRELIDPLLATFRVYTDISLIPRLNPFFGAVSTKTFMPAEQVGIYLDMLAQKLEEHSALIKRNKAVNNLYQNPVLEQAQAREMSRKALSASIKPSQEHYKNMFTNGAVSSVAPLDLQKYACLEDAFCHGVYRGT